MSFGWPLPTTGSASRPLTAPAFSTDSTRLTTNRIWPGWAWVSTSAARLSSFTEEPWQPSFRSTVVHALSLPCHLIPPTLFIRNGSRLPPDHPRRLADPLLQDLDVAIRSMHADPLPIPDQPGRLLHPDDGRQAVLPCDHRAMGHQTPNLGYQALNGDEQGRPA